MKVRLALLASVVLVLAVPVGASAHPSDATNSFIYGLGGASAALTHSWGGQVNDGGANFTKTSNMRLKSFLARPPGAPNAFGDFISDLAFWGNRAYQGTFDGFRIIDIKDPRNPKLLKDYDECANLNGAGQGDVVVWGSILVRSWDSNNTMDSTCDGEVVPKGTPVPPGTEPTLGNGFEGLHVFDVSDPGNPDLVASVDLKCGSHTASGVPDLRNRRLIVYSTPSNAFCEGIDIVEVPLSRPEEAEARQFEFADKTTPATPADNFACHDTAVILGRANKAACAGGVGFAVWSLGGKDGGSRDNPRFLYSHVVPEIADRPPHPDNVDNPTGHSAAFSWDAKTIIFGHEPGGGVNLRCLKNGTAISGANGPGFQTSDMKSFFFYKTDSGQPEGKWTLTRDQSELENCTLHNYNIVPTKYDDILVHGSYQSGIGVLDFSNRANAREIAYADPAPLPKPPNANFQIGGDWGSYFYNGYIYESDITRGLYVWKLSDRDTERAMRLRHLNPQTQEFTIGAKKDHDRWNKGDKWHDDRWDD